MTNVICELVCIRDLLNELSFTSKCSMSLYCGNQDAVHIAQNPIFHERKKQTEVDYHLLHQKIEEKIAQAYIFHSVINWHIYLQSLSERHELILFVAS